MRKKFKIISFLISQSVVKSIEKDQRKLPLEFIACNSLRLGLGIKENTKKKKSLNLIK